MKRVAIIGAGPAGLVSAKCARDAGLYPVIFEKNQLPGGLWAPYTGGIWPGMRTNLSKYSCCFSDFPHSLDTPDFPSEARMYDYLRSYIRAYSLQGHIYYGCEVISADQNRDEDWQICYRDHFDGDVKTYKFDFCIFASGFFEKPFMPDFAGRDRYKGAVLHASDYKNPMNFRDLRVAVIGNAFSGAEIAADISRYSAHTTNIFRKPVRILPRYMHRQGTDVSVPVDLALYSRASNASMTGLSPEERNRKARRGLHDSFGDQGDIHPTLAINPHSGDPVHVAISDDYPSAVRKGRLTPVKGEIAEYTGTGLRMRDGTCIECDVVVACTGYTPLLPYMDRDILDKIDYEPSDRLQPLILHKATLHPDLPGAAFVGMYKGPYFGIMELQARWASAMFTGGVAPPSPSDQYEGLMWERAIRNQEARPQFPHGDYVAFADDLAGQIGAVPDHDGAGDLGNRLWGGPLIPAHYRLRGPDAAPEAARYQMREIDRRLSMKKSVSTGPNVIRLAC